MWLIGAIVASGFLVFIGLTVVPAFKEILDSFIEGLVETIPSLTPFESMIMGLYPVAIFLVIFLGAILIFRQARKKKE